jgi:hypothetical protein
MFVYGIKWKCEGPPQQRTLKWPTVARLYKQLTKWLTAVQSKGRRMTGRKIIGTAKYFCDEVKITDKHTFWQLDVNFRYCQMIWHLSGHVGARFKEFYCIHNIHIFLFHHFSGHLTQFSHPEDAECTLISTQFETPKHDHQLRHRRAACLTLNVLEDIHEDC